MKKKVYLLVSISLLVIVALLLSVGIVSAEGAEVLIRPDGEIRCDFTIFGGIYRGSGTLVRTLSGEVHGQCNATLVWGDPVPERTTLTGTIPSPFGPVNVVIVFTPGGQSIWYGSN